MGRTRGFAWYHIIFFAVPVLGLVFGIQQIVRKRHAGETPQERVVVAKPSHFLERAVEPPVSQIKKEETPLAAKVEKPAVEKKEREVKAEEPDEDFEAALDATLKESRKPALAVVKPEVARVVLAPAAPAAPTTPMTPMTVVGPDSSCGVIEFRGEGPSVAIQAPDWELLLTQYADVRRALLGWLDKNRKGFAPNVASFIERQIIGAKLQRSAVTAEPDLAWRGMGVISHEATPPLIYLGAGFAKLARREPARAKFEMARLVAQSFAPCEMKRNDVGEAWGPLLQCLQVSEPTGCAKGGYSEAGWAVATTIAAAVAAPSCVIPAFKNPEMARCLTKMPLQILWKESRR